MEPRARADRGKLVLENQTIAAEWQVSSSGLRIVHIHDKRTGRTIVGPQPVFSLILSKGAVVDTNAMKVVGGPHVEILHGNPRAARLSERLPGRQLIVNMQESGGKIEATWRGVLRRGSHYIRQEVSLKAIGRDLPLHEIELIDLEIPGAQVVGRVNGSPVAVGTWFLGFEHPLSTSRVEGRRARCSLVTQLPLRVGHEVTYSMVIGVTADGQLRRQFLHYIERERAHPYRTFLHYNSWYDLGFATPFDEVAALDAIEAIGEELHVKHGVILDSFLFDDGWDDHKMWGFNAGFPRGFTPLREAAERYAAAPGVWLSPWGGYDKLQQERLAFGKERGFEINQEGFALSGPIYYRRFREVCLEMIRVYGVNQFKFDGTGNAASAIPGSQFGSDFEAAIHLIGDLRAEKPDLYVNLTRGTYPSPFWLQHADSIWRGGEDVAFFGVGSDRQQWMTYRDAETFMNIVLRGPLYPLNALMLHGVIFAKHAKKLNTDPSGAFEAEIRSYFGTGTQLQEMYVTHSLLSEQNWDALAEAAKWSRRNAAVLFDTHWIGGNPARLEVYGWASWSPQKGILTLRNPSDKPQPFDVDVQAAFELPVGAPQRYTARSPWKKAAMTSSFELRAGCAHTFKLAPFEVLTLEATP